MQLTYLPLELLMTILINLDFRDLIRCRQVCTMFRTLVDQDVHAQYKSELAVAGMDDGPPSTLTPAERLKILRARQDAWNKLAWTARDEIPMLEGGVWELYGNVLAQAQGDRKLHFKQIPSAIRGVQGTEWAIEDVGCKIRDFGMDPAQDLLVVIEHVWVRPELTCRVHLRSLATGAPHPAGPKGGVLTHKPKPGGYSYAIQTSQDNLGLLMSSQEEDTSELLIWEWKTGTLRLHITGPELPSFAFLTSQYLLLAVQPPLELDEENIIQGPNNPYLVVVDLAAAPPSQSEPTPFASLDYVCAFHYPPLGDTFNLIAMSIRSDPGPYWRPNPALKVPFSLSREDRLFVITLWVMEGHGLLSLVPASTFLAAVSTLSPGETRREFEWSEWGPDGSRMLLAPATHTSVWVCYVYGMTFALSIRQGSQKVVFTLDFNQLAIRRAQGGGRGGEEDGQSVVTDASVFNPARVFKERVTTALPYRLRKLMPFGSDDGDGGGGGGFEGEGHFDAVMLAEDALIMVSSSHIRKYRILSF